MGGRAEMPEREAEKQNSRVREGVLLEFGSGVGFRKDH